MCIAVNGPELGEGDELLAKALDRKEEWLALLNKANNVQN